MKKHLFVLAVSLLSFCLNGQICFAPAVNYSVSSGLINIASSDFNNDGNQDIVVVSQNINSISVFNGTGSGTFTLNASYPTGGSNAYGIFCNDITGDGQEDLVVLNVTSNNFRLLIGSAQGTFAPSSLFNVGSGPHQIISANFNNDLYQDVANTNWLGNTITVSLGGPANTFSAAVPYSTATNPSYLCSVDLNNDGNLDIINSNAGSANVSVRLGNGNGTFAAANTFAVGADPRGICAADFNGDGKFDLAVCSRGTGSVSILLASASGTTFSSPTNFGVGISPMDLSAADLNGDGKVDLVVANSSPSSNSISILLGLGTGSFATAVNMATGNGPYDVTINDFNNDSRPDIATPGIDPPYNASVFLNLNLFLSASSQTICSGNPAVITASGVTSYTWNTGANTSSIIVTPSVTTVYSVTGTNSLNCVSAARATTVFVNSTPTLTLNNATICAGDTAVLNVSGASTYTWNTGPTSNSIAVSPSVLTNYLVIGTSTNGCTSLASSSVMVNQLPLVTISSNPPDICYGGTATLTASGANTYTWNNSATGISIIVSPTITTTYTTMGADANSCKAYGLFLLDVNPSPTLSVIGNTFVCANANVLITASGANSYSWSNGANSSNINVTPSVTTIYTVIGANSYSCTDSATLQVNTTSLETPSICVITVDSLSINNEIYWEKVNYPQADSFIVYRESSASFYTPIARIPKSAYSSYIDTNRSIGPNNGNPNFTSYKYKLQYRDSCGNLSALSPYHKTIFITDYQTGNFSWNYYNIEGIGDLQTVNYNLWRQSVLTGTSVLVGGTSGTAFSDAQYSTLSQSGNVKWYVSTSGFNCNPSQKNSSSSAAGKSGTKSNNSNERQFPTTLGIANSPWTEISISIYPNPTDDKLIIEPIISALSFNFCDLLGRIIFEGMISDHANQISTKTINNGVYFLCLYDKGKLVKSEKVIVQHN